MISPASPLRAGRPLWVAVGLTFVVAIAAPLRFGWERLAPDDATYLYVGRTVLDGRLPTDPAGVFYGRRAPVYPVFLAATDLAGATNTVGPHLATWAVAVAGLVGAVLLAHRLAGAPAAIGTALVLAATPAVWLTASTLRIDLPLTAGVVATVAALFRPTTRRWLLAGALFGVTMLLKETVGLLALAPLAWLGALEPRRWWELVARYWASAVAVMAWWWALVLVEERRFFPWSSLTTVGGETFPRSFSFNPLAWGLVGLFVLGWVAFAIRFRADPRARVVVAAGAALAVPAALAWHQHLALRQFVPIAVLSSLTLGTLGGTLTARWLSAGGWRRGLAAAVCATAVVSASTAQLRLDPLYRRPALAAATADWLRDRLEPGAVVAMNRLSRSELAYELYGRATVSVVGFVPAEATSDPEDYVWLGVFNDHLYGLERAELRRVLGDPDVQYFVVLAPHRTASSSFTDALSDPDLPGIELVERLEREDQQAFVFEIEPGGARRAADTLPTVVTPEAEARLATSRAPAT